jgi:predicted rRNA methylase YqxC with S4 and FtsJ domains
MESKKVIIELSEYERLRDFYENITNGNICKKVDTIEKETISYISSDEAYEETKNKLNDNDSMTLLLKGEIRMLRALLQLEIEKVESQREMISRVKNFNFWQFRKWKKRNEKV